MSSLSNKSVKLAVRKHLTTDLRHPIDAHKLARAREQKKVEPAMKLDPVVRQNALDWIDMPEWRVEELARKYAPEDAYEPDEVDDE